MRARFGAAALALAVALAVALAAAAQAPLPPPRHGGVYVIAHRGAHEGGIPENTLAACRKAIELGCDFVEVDLRTTKDGAIVSIHNATVDAYTKDAAGRVRDFTLAELKALDIGSRSGPAWAAERIPTFDEILELCKGKTGIYLDHKDAAVDLLAAKIDAHGMAGAIVWYAGTAQLARAAELCPGIHPMPEGGPALTLPFVLKQVKPPVIASVMDNTDQAYVNAVHAAGALLFTDDAGPESWNRLLEWGVDGIQTDHPAALIERLKRR